MPRTRDTSRRRSIDLYLTVVVPTLGSMFSVTVIFGGVAHMAMSLLVLAVFLVVLRFHGSRC